MYNFVQDDRCMTTLTVCTVLTYNTTVFTNRIVARFPSPIFFFTLYSYKDEAPTIKIQLFVATRQHRFLTL